MTYTWDPRKASSNLKKHGVSFDEATTVFGNPLAMIFMDEDHGEQEDREIIIGHSILNRLLLICFTERTGNVVRIFSARKATRRERKEYEQNT